MKVKTSARQEQLMYKYPVSPQIIGSFILQSENKKPSTNHRELATAWCPSADSA